MIHGTACVPGFLLVLAWLCLGAGASWGGEAPGSGIVDSPHDFTRGSGIADSAKRRAQTCVFCHFPQARTAVFAVSAAWIASDQDQPARNFFWSQTPFTTGGTLLPSNLGTWSGPSKNCLHCHGGSAPIADVARRKQGVSATQLAPLWGGRGHIATTNGDMEGTHPVGIPYPFMGASGTYNNISTGRDVDIRTFVAAPTKVKLYTYSHGHVVRGGSVGATGIECSSCHDVHNEDVRDRWLLRDSLREICLDCHLK